MVTLRLLGGITLTDPTGEEISSLLSQPKRMAVLAYLAVQGKGEYLRRDDLMARFWPDSDLPHARNALNQVLHSFRQDLGEGVVRTRGKHEVGLNPDRFECDVWAFREALKKGRMEEAPALYEGPLMPGFHLNGGGEFDRWLEAEREVLREAAAGAAWALAHRLIGEGKLVRAERTAQRALALVWTDESPVRRFISALAEAGDRAGAVRFYEKFRCRLLEDLDLEPSPPTREVAEAIRNGDGADGSPRALPPSSSGEASVPLGPGGILPSDAAADPSGRTPSGTGVGGSGPGSIDLTGPHVTPASPPSGSAPTGPVPRRHEVWWWAAATVLVVPVLLLLKGAGSPTPAGSPPPDRPFTVLADVGGTGDAEERAAVGFLLRTGLDMSHVVRTVPDPDVERTLDLMDRGEGAPLDPTTAREVGVRLGVGTVVVPRLDRLGETYSLVIRVEDAATGNLQAGTRGRVGDVGRVVELVDSLVLDLRQKLGEARGTLAQREPLPQVLTTSLEALREFQLAQEAGPVRAGTAVRHLRRAVTADTAFAMAWLLMASYYGNFLNQPDSAELASQQVRRFRDRLTESRRADQELHRRFRQDVALWDVALEEAEAAVIRNPRYLNNYSVYTAFPGGLPDSALNIRFRLEGEGAAKARRFDPDLSYEARCFINTQHLAAALDRMDEFHALLDSMNMRVPPACSREMDLFESLADGAWDRADSLVEHSPGDWPWPTVVEVALLQMVPLRGRIRAAHAMPVLNQPETRAFRPDSSGLANVAHLLLQVAYHLPLEEAPEETFQGRGEPKALEGRGWNEVTDYVLYGVRESILGDTVEARRVARRLEAMRDTATSRTFERAFEPWFSLMEVGPAYRRGDWDAVIATLEPMEARIHEPRVGHLAGDDYLIWWLLAEAHENRGQLRDGIQYLESILERPRFRRDNWLIQGFIHPAARFKLAGLHARIGEVGEARKHYRIFLETFTDPDPEFQWMVTEARAAVEGEISATRPRPGRSPWPDHDGVGSSERTLTGVGFSDRALTTASPAPEASTSLRSPAPGTASPPEAIPAGRRAIRGSGTGRCASRPHSRASPRSPPSPPASTCRR